MSRIQYHFRQHTYEVAIKKGFLLLCLFFISLFIALGFWQLYRYHFKKILLTTYQQRLTGLPISFLALDETNDLHFQRVRVSGIYDNSLTMFIQNKFYQGKAGYEVLTPLQIKGTQQLLLVDRGWVAKPNNKAIIQINEVTGPQAITGYIKILDERQFILGKNILYPEKMPIVMQKINIVDIAQATGRQFYPFVLRLDASMPNGFVRDWIVTAMPPERHLGYAVQWFFLAVLVFVGCIIFCSERKDAK